VTDFLVDGQVIYDALALYKTVSEQESILIVKPAGAKCEHSEHNVKSYLAGKRLASEFNSTLSAYGVNALERANAFLS
jgi:hypothetical protein